MIFVLDGFIFRQVIFFRWIFLLGIFGLDVFFILTFQMDLLVGIRLMILLLEQHGFFVFFLVCLDIQNHSDHWCFPDTNPSPQKNSGVYTTQ